MRDRWSGGEGNAWNARKGYNLRDIETFWSESVESGFVLALSIGSKGEEGSCFVNNI